MKLYRFVFGLVCLLLAACTQVPTPRSEPLPLEPQASNWAALGEILDKDAQNNVSADYAIAVFNGNPVVVWPEDDGTSYNLYAKRWNGSTWIQLGGALDVSLNHQAYTADVALDAVGNPVVSWTERNGTSSNIYVKRWNGSSWVQLGSSLNVTTTLDVRSSSLALDSSGNPVVAWEECSNAPSSSSCNRTEGYVKRWNGSSWVQLGSALNITTIQFLFSPSLALDSSGNPVVSWLEFNNVWNIYVKRWNGSSWVQMGTTLNTQNASSPSIAVDSAGNPVVSWAEGNDLSNNIYVKRWEVNNWVQLGGTLNINPTHSSTHPSLALDNSGNPMVSWYEDNGISTSMYVKRWNSLIWIRVGSVIEEKSAHSAYGGIASNSLALDSSGNPFVAVLKNFGSFAKNDLYVKRLSSGLWLPLPATDRNLVKNATEASVALRTNNTIGVAWQEDDGNSNNIYASFWNGDNWVRYGGALDVTVGNQATVPSLAFQSNNLPVVTWQEKVGMNSNIFIKQWNGSAWINYGTGAALDQTVTNNAYAPSLALDSTNNPYVAWYETVSGNNNIFVKRWNGTNWVTLGSALDITLLNQATNPSLAIDSMNRPVVAWQECRTIDLIGECTRSEIYIKRWNGASWDWLSDNRVFTGLSINPSLAINSMDIPIVAWQEDDNIRVKRWNGNTALSNWSALGDTLDRVADNQASHPSLDVRPDGNPVVAWTEVMFETTTNSFYSYLLVKRWNGTAWVSINSTTSSLNRSKTKNTSYPSVAVGSNNSINAGFQESDKVSTNLYLTRF